MKTVFTLAVIQFVFFALVFYVMAKRRAQTKARQKEREQMPKRYIARFIELDRKGQTRYRFGSYWGRTEEEAYDTLHSERNVKILISINLADP
jgi:membrane protein implicated in regulation of membrane protease activity